MQLRHMAAYVLAGLCLANALPHLLHGVSGESFQTPFAHPPGQGLSSAQINVWWGFFNLVLSYLFSVKMGQFDMRKPEHVVPFAIGFLGSSLLLAYAFAPFHR